MRILLRLQVETAAPAKGRIDSLAKPGTRRVVTLRGRSSSPQKMGRGVVNGAGGEADDTGGTGGFAGMLGSGRRLGKARTRCCCTTRQAAEAGGSAAHRAERTSKGTAQRSADRCRSPRDAFRLTSANAARPPPAQISFVDLAGSERIKLTTAAYAGADNNFGMAEQARCATQSAPILEPRSSLLRLTRCPLSPLLDAL